MNTTKEENKKRKNEKTKSKKGFVFTLLILIIIAYMIVEFNIFFLSYKVRQESEPSKIRSMVLIELADHLSPYQMTKVSEIVGYRALYGLNEKAKMQPVNNPAQVLEELMVNGNSTSGGVSLTIDKNSTLSYWSEKLSNISSKMGFSLKTTFSNFNIKQIDPYTIQINYTFSYELKDSASPTKISTSFPVSVNISIIGLEDPLLYRNVTYGTEHLKRSIFPAPSQYINNWVIKIGNTSYGKGWFYGKIFNGNCLDMDKDTFDKNIPDSQKFDPENKKKILCTTSTAVAESYGSIFGAVMLFDDSVTSNTIESTLNSLNVPSVGSNSSYPSLPSAVLIKSDNDTQVGGIQNHTIYNIENIRSFVICGYYYNSTAAVAEGYSYLSRINGTAQINDPNNIETILVGYWVPNSFNTSKNYSSIDYQYLAGMKGNKTMGMPGCHWLNMCNASSTIIPSTEWVRFRIDSAHARIYNLVDIICGGSVDRCGGN